MQKDQLQKSLIEFKIIEQDGLYTCNQVKLDLVLKTMGSTWSINEILSIQLLECNAVVIETQEAHYSLAIDEILALKMHRRHKTQKAGFGR
jgi:hypothetical protein